MKRGGGGSQIQEQPGLQKLNVELVRWKTQKSIQASQSWILKTQSLRDKGIQLPSTKNRREVQRDGH